MDRRHTQLSRGSHYRRTTYSPKLEQGQPLLLVGLAPANARDDPEMSGDNRSLKHGVLAPVFDVTASRRIDFPVTRLDGNMPSVAFGGRRRLEVGMGDGIYARGMSNDPEVCENGSGRMP